MRRCPPLAPTPVASRKKIAPRTWGQGCLTWELVAHEELCVFHEHMPPSSFEIAHYHRTARQVFFVLTGALTIHIAGRDHRLEAQEALEVPPGVAHQVKNLSAADCSFLVVSHPATARDRVAVPES